MKKMHHGGTPTGGVLTKEEIEMLSEHHPGLNSVILVVDDDVRFRKMLTDVLRENLPYTVEEAANGIEASIRIGSRPPDLMIMDIFMPEMDGLELCKIIKKDPNLANLKVIIITGFPGHEKVKKLEDMGFTNILSKPFDIQEFLQTVDLLLKSS
jgi:CheY-like chemotaxis protein